MAAIVKNGKPSNNIRLDWYTIGKDVLREWSVILMITIAMGLFSYIWQYTRYTPVYSMTATFTVNTRSATTDIYSTLRTTTNTAETFSKVLESSLMKKKVAQDVGMGYMPGRATAKMVEDTNLLEVTVEESSPKLANDVYHSIMNNYNQIAEPLLGVVVLNALIDSEIPTRASNPFDPWSGVAKVMLITFVCIIVFLCVLSYLKDTVRREEDIEAKLDTKLLGTLNHEKKYKKGFGKNRQETKTILISDPMVSFRYAESAKKIGNKIASKMERRGAKTVLVTSVMENEGKSTVAANIALSLSKRSDKVLLMDGDFRKPALYKIFGMDPETIESFGEVLNGNANLSHLICRKKNLNLSLILNSVRYPDSTDMISHDLMSEVMKVLKSEFDYIVIDSSPMALVADTQEWMEIVDSAIIVVRQNSSSVRDINDAIAMLNRDKVKLLGCIFNNVEGQSDRFNTGHYGRYGKYGKYGKYGRYGSATDYSQYSDYSQKTSEKVSDQEEMDSEDELFDNYDILSTDGGIENDEDIESEKGV